MHFNMKQHSFGGNLQFEKMSLREKKIACSVVILDVPVIHKVRNMLKILLLCKIIYLFIRMSQNHLGGLAPSLLYFR